MRQCPAEHIAGSIHIPLHELEKRIVELSSRRGKEIICSCRGGNRSSHAAVKLIRRDFSAVNLKGGIVGWTFHHKHKSGS